VYQLKLLAFVSQANVKLTFFYFMPFLAVIRFLYLFRLRFRRKDCNLFL